MKPGIVDVERGLARLGVQLACAPAEAPVDVERVLLASTSALRSNPRVLGLVVTWLVTHRRLVADHRLARLAVQEASAEQRAVLGLVIESAREAGAAGVLGASLRRCSPLSGRRVLFDVDRAAQGFAEIAERAASPIALRWGWLASAVELRPQSIRPIAWVRDHNPWIVERLRWGGDLRCSIFESLRLDAGGRPVTKSEVSRLVAATKVATLGAIKRLEDEGVVRVEPVAGSNRHAVRLSSAA